MNPQLDITYIVDRRLQFFYKVFTRTMKLNKMNSIIEFASGFTSIIQIIT